MKKKKQKLILIRFDTGEVRAEQPEDKKAVEEILGLCHPDENKEKITKS